MQKAAQNRSGNSSDKDNSTLFGILLGIAVLAFWLLWASSLGQKAVALWGGTNDAETKLSAAGQFGDMFGGVNALFTALAFSAVAWSAFLQRREMKMQRDELQAQREQLELQRQEMEATRKVIAQQAFESTFFQLIDMVRGLHQNIAGRNGEKLTYGTGAVAVYAKACHGIFLEYARGDYTEAEREQIASMIGEDYRKRVYDFGEASLGPYFRALYHLVKLVHLQSALSDSDKRRYANIARSILSSDDLLLLAANGCSKFGRDFRPLIEKYGLLKHLQRTATFPVVEMCFAERAFRGENESHQ